MSTWGDARALLWPIFKDIGYLVEASTILPGCTEPTTFDVAYRRPDVDPYTHVRSADYEIEYRHADAPTLREGAEIIVDGVLYRVREDPRIDAMRGDDGFWRLALLTEIR